MIALAVLAVISLFQSFSDQVMRGQRQLSDTTYIRYLGDMALTEATVVMQEMFRESKLTKLDDVRALAEIPVPVTQGAAKALMGGQSATVKVRPLLDKAAQELSWGDNPDEAEWLKKAFPGEAGGLIVLLAEINVDSNLGLFSRSGLSAKMTRGFAFRLVSPAPPKGLDEILFLGHNWEYFQGRLQGAHLELFALLEEAGRLQTLGPMYVDDRASGILASAQEAKGIVALSIGLYLSIKDVNTAMANASGDDKARAEAGLQALETKLTEACGGKEECEKLHRRSMTEVTYRLACATELQKSFAKSLASTAKQEARATAAASNPSGPTIDCTLPENRTKLECNPGATIKLVDDASAKPDGTPREIGNASPSLKDQLRDAINTNKGDAEIDRIVGEMFKVDQANPDASFWKPTGETVNSLYMPELGYLARTQPGFDPVRDGKDYALRGMKLYGSNLAEIVKDTLKVSLIEQLKKLRNEPNNAGKQLSIETYLLWSKLGLDKIKADAEAGKAALGEIKLSVKTDNPDQYLYNSDFPSMKEPIEKLIGTLEAARDQTAGQTPPVSVERSQSKWLEAFVTNNLKLGQAVAEYFTDEKIRNYTEGPVYISKDAGKVTEERLEYLFIASPTRLGMIKQYPLPSAPAAVPPNTPPPPAGSGSAVSLGHRGFLTPHGNWTKDIGGASSGAIPFKPDYKVDEDIVAKLRETRSLAIMSVKAWEGLTDPGGIAIDTPEVKELLEEMRKAGVEEADQDAPDPKAEPECFNNDMAQCNGNKGTDGELVGKFKTEWNTRVGEFLTQLQDTHKLHSSPAYKAWPKEPPAGLEDTKGWVTEGDPKSKSNGQKFLDAVLGAKVNRVRSAFRFKDWAEFQQMLKESGNQVRGTYFIEAPQVEIDAAALASGGTGAGTLKGHATLVFQGNVTLKGKLAADPGPLVLIATGENAGFELKGSEIEAFVMCNGMLKGEPGNKTSITGSLITTGTLPQAGSPQDVPENFGNDAKWSEWKGKKIGELDPIEITYKSPYDSSSGSATSRESFMRMIFSPFRMAQDFEVRREMDADGP